MGDPTDVPTEELARAESERGEIVLRRRGTGAVELRVNGVFVMDTVETATEQALASRALAVVDDPRAVLVGGLGLGFTAHAVLADPRVEKVAVVEIEEALVGWMRDGTVPHGPSFLADERLTIVVADVRTAVAEATPASYDLVLLDVDNGPGYLVHDSNAEMYGAGFLRQVHALLRPGGALVVWSAAAAPELADAVEAVFGSVVPVPFDVDLQGRAEQYWLYQARR
jgi:spermidine synthase